MAQPGTRRVLTPEEKQQIRQQFGNTCYLCTESLDGYGDAEIQYDHIYAFAEGYPQDLSNFAPVHASRDSTKRNYHAAKGRKSPYEYKEELRIHKMMEAVTGLKNLCPTAKPVVYQLDLERRVILLNGRSLPLYNQRIGLSDNWYFFDEIEVEHIESDDQIQLRPLEDKIYGLIMHLRQTVQLLPSVGRLDTKDSKIKLFDGQHKAVASDRWQSAEAHPLYCLY